jgi:hypothetical protein
MRGRCLAVRGGGGVCGRLRFKQAHPSCFACHAALLRSGGGWGWKGTPLSRCESSVHRGTALKLMCRSTTTAVKGQGGLFSRPKSRAGCWGLITWTVPSCCAARGSYMSWLLGAFFWHQDFSYARMSSFAPRGYLHGQIYIIMAARAVYLAVSGSKVF